MCLNLWRSASVMILIGLSLTANAQTVSTSSDDNIDYLYRIEGNTFENGVIRLSFSKDKKVELACEGGIRRLWQSLF